MHVANWNVTSSITFLIIYMKKLLDSDWLRTVQFFLNTVQKRGNWMQKKVIKQAFWLDNELRSSQMANQISCFQIKRNCTRRSGSCNFSFLKNSLVQINSKLNSKPYDYLYKWYLKSCFCTSRLVVTSWSLSFLSRNLCNENAAKYYTYNSLRLMVFENNAGGISSKWLLLMLLEVRKNDTGYENINHNK